MKFLPPLRFALRPRSVAIIVLLFAWLVGLELIWFMPALQRIHKAASEISLQVAHSARSSVSASLENSLTGIKNAALDIGLEPNRASTIMRRLVDRNAAFESAALVDRNGRRLAYEGPAQDSRDYSKVTNVYLALAGTASFGDVFPDARGEPSAIAAVPIRLQDGQKEVLVVHVSLQRLVDILGAFKEGTWHVYITDKTGVDIIDPDQTPGSLASNVLARPIVQKVVVDGGRADGLASDDSYSARGVRMFAVGEPIPVTNWGLFVERPQRDAFVEEPSAIALAATILILGLIAVVAAFGSYAQLAQLNERLNALLAENYQSAKLLVARDLELNEKNARLQELDEIKSDFVSVAAHQLRTPITGIRWTFHALLDGSAGPLNSEQEGIVREGLRVTINAVGLINDLLDVARVEEGRFGYTMVACAPLPLLREAVGHADGHAREKGVIIETVAEGSLPDIPCDKEKIMIVFNNLLENAVKYTPPGGRVRAAIAAREREVEFSIADSGIGIPKSDMKKLFTKFFRAGNAVLFQTSGTGLGLYMVKSIVERHGGSVSIESEENKGTTVAFTLPLA